MPAGTFATLRIETATVETNNPFNSCGAESAHTIVFWLAPNVGWVQMQWENEPVAQLLQMR